MVDSIKIQPIVWSVWSQCPFENNTVVDFIEQTDVNNELVGFEGEGSLWRL
jgi:hypothetical protein